MPSLEFAVRATDDTGPGLSHVNSDLDAAEQHAGKAEGAFGKLGGALGSLGSIAGGVALGGGVAALPGKLFEFVNAAAEDEAATLRVSQAIKNLGGDYDANLAKVNDRIASGQKLAFSDDEIRDSYVKLASATGDSDEALKRQTAAMDLARGANIPLLQASTLLGKATDENVQVLKRMGITLKDGATEADLFAAVQQKFGGQADQYAKSTAGQFAQTKIALAETGEAIGYILLPAINKVGQFFAEAVPKIQEFVGSLSEKAAPVMDKISLAFDFLGQHKEIILGVALGIMAALVPALLAWAAAAGAAALATLAAAAPVVAIGLVLAALGVGIVELVGHWGELEAKFPQLQAASDAVERAWHAFADFITGTLVPAFQSMIDWITGNWGSIQEILSGPFEVAKTLITANFDLIKDEIQLALNFIGDLIAIFKDLFTGNWSKLWADVKSLVSDAWNNIKQLVGDQLDAIGALLSLAWDGIKALAQAAWDGIKALLVAAWDGLKEAVSSGIEGLISLLASLPGRAASALGDLSSLLVHAGVQLIEGFVSGILSKFGDVASTLGSLKDKLTSWKGPPEEDAVLLFGVGQLVIAGFQHGLESKYPDVQRSLQTFGGSLGGFLGTGPATLANAKVIGPLQQSTDSWQRSYAFIADVIAGQSAPSTLEHQAAVAIVTAIEAGDDATAQRVLQTLPASSFTSVVNQVKTLMDNDAKAAGRDVAELELALYQAAQAAAPAAAKNVPIAPPDWTALNGAIGAVLEPKADSSIIFKAAQALAGYIEAGDVQGGAHLLARMPASQFQSVVSGAKTVLDTYAKQAGADAGLLEQGLGMAAQAAAPAAAKNVPLPPPDWSRLQAAIDVTLDPKASSSIVFQASQSAAQFIQAGDLAGATSLFAHLPKAQFDAVLTGAKAAIDAAAKMAGVDAGLLESALLSAAANAAPQAGQNVPMKPPDWTEINNYIATTLDPSAPGSLLIEMQTALAEAIERGDSTTAVQILARTPKANYQQVVSGAKALVDTWAAKAGADVGALEQSLANAAVAAASQAAAAVTWPTAGGGGGGGGAPNYFSAGGGTFRGNYGQWLAQQGGQQSSYPSGSLVGTSYTPAAPQPTMVNHFTINALDAQGVAQAMPEVARQLDLHLKQGGGAGLTGTGAAA